MPLLQRNLIILFVCQGVFGAGSVLLTIVGGVVGSRLAGTPGLATLPVSIMIVATALSTVPVSACMARFGRRAGIAGASLVAVVSALGAAGALHQASFIGFCLAATGFGVTMATAQQLRFAATECVPAAKAGNAVSFILLGAIGGAFLGSSLASLGGADDTPRQAAVARFLGLAATHLVVLLLVAWMRPLEAVAAHSALVDAPAPRPWPVLLRSRGLLLAVAAAVVGQGTMTFLMTATPVSMHVVDGHPMHATAQVVQAHVIAMYAPSLVSGYLIQRIGLERMMASGAALLLVCITVGLLGHELLHYAGTLVLLGVGWNFLFVAGTTSLVATYQPNERFRVQAFNDFSVFGAAATASLLAGASVLVLGWERVLLIPVPFLIATLVATGVASFRRRAGTNAMPPRDPGTAQR